MTRDELMAKEREAALVVPVVRDPTRRRSCRMCRAILDGEYVRDYGRICPRCWRRNGAVAAPTRFALPDDWEITA